MARIVAKYLDKIFRTSDEIKDLLELKINDKKTYAINNPYTNTNLYSNNMKA